VINKDHPNIQNFRVIKFDNGDEIICYAIPEEMKKQVVSVKEDLGDFLIIAAPKKIQMLEFVEDDIESKYFGEVRLELRFWDWIPFTEQRYLPVPKSKILAIMVPTYRYLLFYLEKYPEAAYFISDKYDQYIHLATYWPESIENIQ
jgi:hypothetical protein